MTIANLKTHILASGIQFSIEKRAIKVVGEGVEMSY